MKKLFYLAMLSWLIPQATPASAQLQPPPAKTAAREKIIRQAPIVFVGRPLQAEFYKDASGIIYHSTVIQILEVLRGEARLKPGTVELVERVEQSSELEERYRFAPGSVYDQDYGVYFAEPSTNPAKTVPYQTSNGPLIIQLLGNERNAKVSVGFTDHGPSIRGLYREDWATEDAMIAYINGLTRIKPRASRVIESRYPTLRYRDTRPGGKDIYAPVAPEKKEEKVTEVLVEQPGLILVEPTVQGKSLPLEAFKQLPAVMARIRANEPLSKQDSAYIKRYIPEQMPSGPAREKGKVPKRKAKKSAGKGGAGEGFGRVAVGDTTLSISVRSLSVERPRACERAYRGEVWLKANQSGLFMNQLYFEMITTADLKLDSSPFGQTLIGTYTPLAGAPDYTFYQSYDAATKRILVACYPSWSSPQRVQLATVGAQPFFRFEYGLVEAGSPPGGVGPSPVSRGTSTQSPTVSFSPLATSASQSYSNFYLSPTSEQAHIFTALEAEPAAVVNQPQPLRINSLHTANQSFVTAGTGMVLTIYGSNFGPIANPADTTQRSRIQFINADTVAGTFLRDVDRGDVLYWGEDSIKVRIPSTGISRDQGRDRSVGGGVIKISTYCGRETQSMDALDIRYNLANTLKNKGKQPIYLIGRDCSRGLTFILDAALAAKPEAKLAIQAALRSWSTQLGVKLVLANTTTLSAGAEDGRNVLYLTSATRTMRTTSISSNPLPSTNLAGTESKLRTAAVEMDVEISDRADWAYDTTGVALCSTGSGGCPPDFYAAILHEIGHCLNLKHVVDGNDIMYFSLSTTQRRTITTGRMAAVAGATKSVTDSRGIRWTVQGVSTFGQLIASCPQNRVANPASSALSVTSASIQEKAILYPNPVSDEAEILPATANKGPWEYWVRDVQGRVVLHAQGAGTAAIKVGKGLPAGFYTIQLYTPQNTSTLKMIKGL